MIGDQSDGNQSCLWKLKLNDYNMYICFWFQYELNFCLNHLKNIVMICCWWIMHTQKTGGRTLASVRLAYTKLPILYHFLTYEKSNYISFKLKFLSSGISYSFKIIFYTFMICNKKIYIILKVVKNGSGIKRMKTNHRRKCLQNTYLSSDYTEYIQIT